ncbi:MAG: glycosyltransferase family 4 protein [Coriobacteriia bacterium]|nr:glycosyltransferase family 4 protein [Coriobacteriia bacterium]
MHVLLDCRMATWTGVGRYTMGLVRALAARGDIEITQVVAPNVRPPVAAYQGAHTVIAAKHPFGLAGAREFGRIAASVAPDVTHCLHFPTPTPVPHPLVVTMHDLTPLLLKGVMPSPFKRAVYRYWNNRAVKSADRIITDATFTIGEIERVFPAAASRVVAIPLGVEDFAEGPKGLLVPVLAELTDWPYLLSMGSTRVHKDLPTLLRAFVRVARTRTDLRLLLVGTDDRAFVDSMLPSAPPAIRDRIVFTGRVEDPELRTLMRGAEAFVFPSRYEGFGLPPLEAMSMGTPVIVADAASLPEVVGTAACLFPPGDVKACEAAIRSVLEDSDLRDDLSRRSLERAALFSWERAAAATAAVYREVAGYR